jgi:hypothetical protein
VIRGLWVCAVVGLVGAGSAFADPASASERYEELLSSFDEALLAATTETEDEVILLEAEEIAAIAEEMSAEGEAGVAVTLLEEAIALLIPPNEE